MTNFIYTLLTASSQSLCIITIWIQKTGNDIFVSTQKDYRDICHSIIFLWFCLLFLSYADLGHKKVSDAFHPADIIRGGSGMRVRRMSGIRVTTDHDYSLLCLYRKDVWLNVVSVRQWWFCYLVIRNNK